MISQKEHAIVSPIDLSTKSPIWADQGVDFGALHVVELLHSFLDLGLGGLDVDEEHQCVDLLNLLHGGLRSHRALDDPILVQLVPSRFYGLSRVLGIPGLCQGLGFVEANLGADLLHLRSCAGTPTNPKQNVVVHNMRAHRSKFSSKCETQQVKFQIRSRL